MNPSPSSLMALQPLTILGPQRFAPNVSRAIEALAVDEGPVAVVTAGWQEREAEVDELRDHVGRPTLNLELYRRAREALEEDPELALGLREKQQRLREMQQLYRLRLDHALEACRELLRRSGPTELLRAERRSAIQALRRLDQGHLRRLTAVHEDFDATWRPSQRDAVAARRREIAAQLAGCAATLVAGGHVAVLLNRLRLFDVLGLLAEMPIVAWSAGAMALSERLVLFHDSPPQGPGNAEVLDNGLGLYRGIVPLPHASIRLRLDDPVRVALLARRFSPAICVALDSGSGLKLDGADLQVLSRTMRLTARGGVSPL